MKILKQKINQDAIDILRRLKKQKIEDDFNDEYGYIKSFVAPNWTLEYEIALSNLDEYIIPAIHEARFENPNSETNSEKFDEWMKEIHAGTDIESQSYEIYKPLLKKNASKAITAQILAEKLAQSEDKEKIKRIILEDEYLNYLKEAIYHVTEKEEN